MFSFIIYYINLLPEIFFLSVWIGLQIFLFISTFIALKTDPAIESTSALLGSSFWVAKASAYIINFNSAVLVLTMCQVSITILRGTVLNHLVPFDKATELHRLASYSLVLFAIIHSAAHYVNFSKIPTLWTSLAFLSGPGATGHILWILLLLIWITSIVTIIRKMRYEVFWYIHQLSVVFFILTSVHGGAFCFIKRDFGSACLGSSTWKWLIGPSSLKMIELLYIQYRVRKFTFISKVIVHQSNVIEIQIKKPSFHYKPGQFLRINCPQIAAFQWHPFTITSAPEENFVSIHISIVGDWTRGMAGLLGCEFTDDSDNNESDHIDVEDIQDKYDGTESNTQTRSRARNHKQETTLNTHNQNQNIICNYSPPRSLPQVFIDGPYGSVNENFDQFEVVICIGAGIGQTPFASILKSMWYSITHPYMSMKLHKIIYYGISREIQVNKFVFKKEMLCLYICSLSVGLLTF